MLIFRRTNCIVTASGIVTLRKQLFSAPVESGLHLRTASGIVTLRKQLFSAPVESGLQSALNRCTEWLLVMIPDAVTIQSDLLKISMVLLETCRGL